MPYLNSPAGKSILFTHGIALRVFLRSQSSLHDQGAGGYFPKGLSTHSCYHQVTESLLLLALQIRQLCHLHPVAEALEVYGEPGRLSQD